jgi:hypothetical protein
MELGQPASCTRRKRVGGLAYWLACCTGKKRRKRGRKAGLARENRPKKVLKNCNDFSISYFNSNSFLIQISNEFYKNDKL